jgi:hypothetical protein
MADTLYMKLYDPTGIKSEATAYATDTDDKLLPPGMWRVQLNGEQTCTVMALDQMPHHWQEQVKRWEKFGETLGD